MKQETAVKWISAAVMILIFLGFMSVAFRPRSTRQSVKSDDSWKLYWLNQDQSSLVSVAYEPYAQNGAQDEETAAKRKEKEGITPEQMPATELITDMLRQLASPTGNIAYTTPIQGFSVNSWVLGDGILTIDFSGEYSDQDRIREILVRASAVNTLCQIDGVTAVIFTIDGEPLTGGDGKIVGSMTADQFIYNAGNEIKNYEKVQLHLYFANAEGNKLVDTYRVVVYNSNIAMERLVVEQVLKGPNSDEVFPTLNGDTKVLSVTTRDGVCYVNLDDSFLTDPHNVTAQVAIYSLVNSLTELGSVRRVQISIDGSTNDTFKDSIKLSTVFERNPGIVEGNDEEE